MTDRNYTIFITAYNEADASPALAEECHVTVMTFAGISWASDGEAGGCGSTDADALLNYVHRKSAR